VTTVAYASRRLSAGGLALAALLSGFALGCGGGGDARRKDPDALKQEQKQLQQQLQREKTNK
jgi:hypothetical protein